MEGDHDFAVAERIARALGYEQTAYTSTSALWGLFCLPENPDRWRGNRRALQHACIIKTRELGFLVVQSADDLGLDEDGCDRNHTIAKIQHTPETCPGRPCGDDCDHVEFRQVPR
jgi:hypothetical protein